MAVLLANYVSAFCMKLCVSGGSHQEHSHVVLPDQVFLQHVCSFAIYSHGMSRQIETHHYRTRLSQDFLLCAVYDSDNSNGRLLGYVYSLKLFMFLSLFNFLFLVSHYSCVFFIFIFYFFGCLCYGCDRCGVRSF